MSRKINLMHELFGPHKNVCANCTNFGRYRVGNKTVRKCSAYGLTHSEASDWNASYAACGLFGREYKGERIINLVKPERKRECEVKGQVEMEWGKNDEPTI